MHRSDGAGIRGRDPRSIHQLLPRPIQEVHPPRGGPGARVPPWLRQLGPGEWPRDIVNINVAIFMRAMTLLVCKCQLLTLICFRISFYCMRIKSQFWIKIILYIFLRFFVTKVYFELLA